MYPAGLIRTILTSYPLPVSGIHGPGHWARVLENGLHLAGLTGADPEVVRLFAVLHDSRRTTEGECYEHGRLAADFARSLRGTHVRLDDDRFELLYDACDRHTDGETDADVTIQACWDADRLDLGRVAIFPDPAKLCTAAARDPGLIRWATERATGRYRPAVLDEWLAELD
jgi:uncharacterized protein